VAGETRRSESSGFRVIGRKYRKEGRRDYFSRSVLTPNPIKDDGVAVTLEAAARSKHGLPLQAAKP
jgi:hypothetical protein